jgi:hypothetical protein
MCVQPPTDETLSCGLNRAQGPKESTHHRCTTSEEEREEKREGRKFFFLTFFLQSRRSWRTRPSQRRRGRSSSALPCRLYISTMPTTCIKTRWAYQPPFSPSAHHWLLCCRSSARASWRGRALLHRRETVGRKCFGPLQRGRFQPKVSHPNKLCESVDVFTSPRKERKEKKRDREYPPPICKQISLFLHASPCR